ncbi:MAG TPA: hypothetical protein VK459_00030, partial [Polyangiaceae bacterium]|nr:hypothetical protein [Polyangiaceae bacterium]
MDEPVNSMRPAPGTSSSADSLSLTSLGGRGGAPVPVEEAPSQDPPELEGMTIGEPIGRGGFAVVWGAVRIEDSAPVALKVGHTDTPLTSERFRRDADAMSSVGPPHAPRVYS